MKSYSKQIVNETTGKHKFNVWLLYTNSILTAVNTVFMIWALWSLFDVFPINF